MPYDRAVVLASLATWPLALIAALAALAGLLRRITRA